MSSICFYVSHIEGLCNSESLVNRLSDDSSWRGSKSASQRLYVIGGESPNKKWKAQGRLFRMFAIYMLVSYSHEETGRFTVWQMESKTRYLKILLRNRVYRLHKFISFTDNCRENKTKLFFTITERILARWLVTFQCDSSPFYQKRESRLNVSRLSFGLYGLWFHRVLLWPA